MELLKAKTKLLLPLVAFIASLICAASCSSDSDDDGGGGASAGLSVDVTEVIFWGAYEAQYIKVMSGKPWKVADYPVWLSISKTSDNGDGYIAVSATLNSTSQMRTGTMTITTDDESVEIRLIQGTPIKVSPDVFEMSPYGNTKTVKIDAIGDWTVENVPEWITVSAMGGSGSEELQVTADNNVVGTKRTAEIEIHQQYGRKVFTVTQEGMEAFTTTPNEVIVLNDGIAFNCNYGSETYGFYWEVFSAADVVEASEEELKTALRQQGIVRNSKEQFGYVWNCQPATDYYICTMAVDKNGKECHVERTPVRTASLLNDRSPKTEVKDISMTSKKLKCSFMMNSYAKSYRSLAYFSSSSSVFSKPDIYFAWEIKHNKYSYYFTGNKNGVVYNINETSKYYLIVTWSADASGNMSDVIVRATNTSSSAKPHAPSVLRHTNMANGYTSDMDNGNIRIAERLDVVE